MSAGNALSLGKADGAHCVNKLLSEEGLFFVSPLFAVGREALQQLNP